MNASYSEYHEVMFDEQRLLFCCSFDNKTDNDKFCNEISLVRLPESVSLE